MIKSILLVSCVETPQKEYLQFNIIIMRTSSLEVGFFCGTNHLRDYGRLV